MIDLNDMLIFAKVAELQGISPAARALNIPKSKVSRRMVMLEEALGTRLLERSTRAVHITEAGNIYLQHCKRVAEEASNALESVQQLSDTPKGLLRISASVTCGQHLIAPYLGAFTQRYPDIEIEMDLNNRRVDMISEGFDLVMRVGQLDDSNLVSKSLGHSRALLCASPSYLDKHGEPLSLEDLQQHRKLVMTDSSRAYRWVFENDMGSLKVVEITPNFSVNDLTTMRTVIVDGGGIGSLPDYLASDSIENGSLKILLPQWRSPIIPYYVMYPSHQGITRKARCWIDFMCDCLKHNLTEN